MSLLRASRHVVTRESSIRSSYAEISKFCRTSHHGTTPKCIRSSLGHAYRNFASSHDSTPDDHLKKTLDEFKATSGFATPLQSHALTRLQSVHPPGIH
jgi:aspartyl-tRNA synthetase